MKRRVEVLYFAWLRRQTGVARETIDLPDTTVTLLDLLPLLRERSPGHAAALADVEGLRAALDQEFAPLEAEIGEAREIALFPPVTGG
jgi:molybdopterin synthase sulfur carrier subunit